jgi:hypothetical protein
MSAGKPTGTPEPATAGAADGPERAPRQSPAEAAPESEFLLGATIPDRLTTVAAAQLLDCHRGQLAQWVRQGLLAPPLRVLGRNVYTRSDLERSVLARRELSEGGRGRASRPSGAARHADERRRRWQETFGTSAPGGAITANSTNPYSRG